MQDPTTIILSARKHGDFAGRTVQEQDAYFAFFAGDAEPSEPPALARALHTLNWLILSTLRARGPEVASTRGQT